MKSTKPINEEKACFDDSSLRRKPLRSHTEREQRGTNIKTDNNLYPIIDDNNLYPVVDNYQEMIDNGINDDTYASQNGAKEHVVCDSSDVNVDKIGACHEISRQSRSQEKDSLAIINSSDKRKVRQRKKVKHEEESRKSPDRVVDSPELNPLDQNEVILPRKNKLLLKELPKRNPYAVKKSTVPGNKLHTPECRSIVIMVLFTVAIISGLAIKGSFFSYSPEERVTFNFRSIVSNFQHSFKGQPDFSFKIFKSALRSINTSEPSAPAVILFLASKGAEELAHNLGEKLVDSVSPTPIKISGKDYEKLDSDSGKKRIDDVLRTMNADSDSEYGAVLVEDLHLIPGETALMFHTYCDNENAPYKHAVYVLIVHMGETIPVNSDMKSWDIAVYKRLNRAWSDIDEDQRGPLLSRLTVSVAAIVKNDVTV